MRKLWDGINSIIAQNICTHPIIDKVEDASGKLIDDPAHMSSNINEYFVNVADIIDKTILRTPHSPLRYLAALLKVLCSCLQPIILKWKMS